MEIVIVVRVGGEKYVCRVKCCVALSCHATKIERRGNATYCEPSLGHLRRLMASSSVKKVMA